MNEIDLSVLDTFEGIFECLSSFIEENEILSRELVSAREDYFKLTGKLNETDLSFSNRMNAFLLWFIFDWQCGGLLKSPFEVFKEEVFRQHAGDADSPFVVAIENHVHSLFETLKLRDNSAVVRDLYSKKKYEVLEPDYLLRCKNGTYFETRLFRFGEKFRFSNYFIPHPPEVKKEVAKHCKLLFKKGDSIKFFLMQLHSYHTKWQRYRNINIKNIYHFDKSIPEAK